MPSSSFIWIYTADGISISAKLLLMGWILHKKTCKGISGRTQTIVAMVHFLQFAYVVVGNRIFVDGNLFYTVATKTVMMLESFFLLYLIFYKYKKTIEKEFDTFWIEVPIILASAISLAYNSNADDPFDVMYYLSAYLGTTTMLPQMYFNFRTGSKNLSITLYVVLSGVTELFYIYYTFKVGYQSEAKNHPLPTINTLTSSIVEVVFCAVYLVLLIIVPKYKQRLPLYDTETISGLSTSEGNPEPSLTATPSMILVTRPKLDRQQSLLETPFLKKSTTFASFADLAKDVQMRLQARLIERRMGQVFTNTEEEKEAPRRPEFKRALSSSFSAELQDDLVLSRETALQSRKKRMTFQRQSSLPETTTQSSSLKIFDFPDEDSEDGLTFTAGEGVFELTRNPKDLQNANFDPKIQASKSTENISPCTKKPLATAEKSSKNRLCRRATLHGSVAQPPQLQPNWKTLAGNLIGTSPEYVKKPSLTHDVPAQQVSKPRKKSLWHNIWVWDRSESMDGHSAQ